MSTSEEKKIGRPEHADALWLMTDIQATVHLKAPILEQDTGMREHFAAVFAATSGTIREKFKDLCQYILELKQKFLMTLARTLPEHAELKNEEVESSVKRRMQILSAATSVLVSVFHAIQEIAEKYLASSFDVEELLAAIGKKYAYARLSYEPEVREAGVRGF